MSARLLKLDTSPSLVDRVYRALLEAIVTGTLPGGARLAQEQIARELAVSRQPVLQALRLLRNDGLVLDAPGRGLLVAPLEPSDITHVYQVRSALDVLAARLATQNRAVLDPELIKRGRKAARGNNVSEAIEADIAFHRAIYVASGNPLIEPSAHVHWRHIRRAMGAVLNKSTARVTVWDEHEAIARAIGRGDVEQAARLTSAHAQRASENIGRHLASVAPETRTTASAGAKR